MFYIFYVHIAVSLIILNTLLLFRVYAERALKLLFSSRSDPLLVFFFHPPRVFFTQLFLAPIMGKGIYYCDHGILALLGCFRLIKAMVPLLYSFYILLLGGRSENHCDLRGVFLAHFDIDYGSPLVLYTLLRDHLCSS